jgi:hypothetical protein
MNYRDVIDKIYVGVVESNIDPYRLGRIKVRVQSMYNDIPINDIPYATPFKSLDGRSFTIPAVGKVVSVVFDNGNIYMPVYHYSESYNKNLQNKLDSLSDSDYQDFYAFLYDHKTQHYIDSKGYTIDYYYNQFNIDSQNINLRLKDNTAKLNLGSKDANQDAVLGTNFFNWFDKFVEQLLLPTSLVGNLSAPILRPEIDALLNEYKSIRDTFTSLHVKLPNNNNIEKVSRDLQTIVETHDSELLVNNQNPFKLGQTNTENSNIISEDVKHDIIQKNETETAKIAEAQPTNILVSDSIDYHEDIYDMPSGTTVTAVTDDGDEYEVSYDDLADEQSRFLNDANKYNVSSENPTDTYDEIEFIDDDNYGTYVTSNVEGTTQNSDIMQTNYPVKDSLLAKDASGNLKTVEIYVDGVIVKHSPYILLQNHIVVVDFYEHLKNFIESAKKDNCYLTIRSSYRTFKEQLDIRRKNKLHDYSEYELLNNDSRLYYPVTGKPGFSMHERGAAVDFALIKGKITQEYVWLVKNGYKYGWYRTLPTEIWHWEYQPWTYRGGSKPTTIYRWVPENHSSWFGIKP